MDRRGSDVCDGGTVISSHLQRFFYALTSAFLLSPAYQLMENVLINFCLISFTPFTASAGKCGCLAFCLGVCYIGGGGGGGVKAI